MFRPPVFVELVPRSVDRGDCNRVETMGINGIVASYHR